MLTELNTVKQILYNNKYDVPSVIDNLTKKDKHQKSDNNPYQKWAKFTYVGKETRAITKVFKGTYVKIAYSTNNSLKKLLDTRCKEEGNKFDQNGVYQLTCPTCSKKYVGQTERPFKTRFKEHYSDFKNAHSKSKFAQHVIEEGHSFGPMHEIMEPLRIANKGRMLDTLERFYIYKETKLNNQINDRLTVQYNPIFETITP
jgi:hypothetical protein